MKTGTIHTITDLYIPSFLEIFKVNEDLHPTLLYCSKPFCPKLLFPLWNQMSQKKVLHKGQHDNSFRRFLPVEKGNAHTIVITTSFNTNLFHSKGTPKIRHLTLMFVPISCAFYNAPGYLVSSSEVLY